MCMTVSTDLTQLGAKAEIPEAPDKAILETFLNPHCDLDYVVRLTAPGSHLCPCLLRPFSPQGTHFPDEPKLSGAASRLNLSEGQPRSFFHCVSFHAG
jgi:hypothetical protein